MDFINVDICIVSFSLRAVMVAPVVVAGNLIEGEEGGGGDEDEGEGRG